ncbi:OmpH family outer membrane protein [Aurantiacibacter sp. D1-12]|uniref:OmpH family outer membrane protein n=1 Tax=Aurantiacibacter sp. D1-12 TaxID=2993658 RepID=UPI00237CAFEB|nr:OmpH family outer membrane protein [Aurantiacibacter sp. D1-12]MDE1466448.1 OmpH family outer membrane protein [Aurantiacibacter sp. D1-12]
MKTLIKPALAAVLAVTAVTAPAIATPAMAQSNERVAVVNVPAIIVNSSAYQTAQTQRQTTYAAQLQQAETRRTALNAQLEPLVSAFNAARAQPNADQAALQQQAAQIQQLQQTGQAELQQILAPVALSQAYVEEQIQDQLSTAIENAARAQGYTLVVTPDVVLFAEASHNMNQAVLDQLNALIPAAQLVPPQGWLPRELREQQAAAAAGQQPATQPATSGR